MDLYVQMWPVWVVLGVLATNLLVVLCKAFEAAGEKAPTNVSNVVALITALVLVLAAVLNVVICVAQTFIPR